MLKNASILAAIDKTIINKKTDEELDALISALSIEIQKAHEKQVKTALSEIARQLSELPIDVDEESIDAILAIGDKHLGASFAAEIRAEADRILEAAFIIGMSEVSGSVVFGAADIKSLMVLQEDLYFWADTYYADNVKDKLEDELREYFEEGLTRDQLAKKIEVALRDVANSGSPYFDLLADHITTKVREIGRVVGYENAGIKQVVIRAQIDDRTTEICRRLNGTVIETTYLRTQVDNYLDACATKDKETIKASWPWLDNNYAESLDSEKAISSGIEDGKIGLPPYHAWCRTITVAEFS